MYRDLQASSNKRHNIKHNTQMIQLSSVVVITMGEIQHCTINPNLHCTMYNSSKNCQHLHSAALCQSAVNPNALLLVLISLCYSRPLHCRQNHAVSGKFHLSYQCTSSVPGKYFNIGLIIYNPCGHSCHPSVFNQPFT